jgi:SEC-C motif-containing protein
MENCPCGSGISYLNCCDVFISGKKFAPTAETLMRSRYTAYTKADIDYIERTMKGPALARFDKPKSQARTKFIQWYKLEVIKSFEENNRHYVEFKAYLSVNHQADILHECSEFIFEDNQWYYIDGKIFPDR